MANENISLRYNRALIIVGLIFMHLALFGGSIALLGPSYLSPLAVAITVSFIITAIAAEVWRRLVCRAPNNLNTDSHTNYGLCAIDFMSLLGPSKTERQIKEARNSLDRAISEYLKVSTERSSDLEIYRKVLNEIYLDNEKIILKLKEVLAAKQIPESEHDCSNANSKKHEVFGQHEELVRQFQVQLQGYKELNLPKGFLLDTKRTCKSMAEKEAVIKEHILVLEEYHRKTLILAGIVLEYRTEACKAGQEKASKHILAFKPRA